MTNATRSEINKRYYEKHIEKINDYNLRYNREKYEQNPEFFREKSRQYYANNKEKIKSYIEKNQDHLKLYRETYHEINKEQINAKTRVRDSVRVECPKCGCCMRRGWAKIL